MRLSVIPLVAVVAVAVPASLSAQYVAYGLTRQGNGAQQLVRFDPTNPGAVTTLGGTGVMLTGIDFRPATGELWGYDGRALYRLDLTTGAAALAFTLTSTTNGNAGFDFNPTVDRIRVVDANGTNLRLNPNDGATTVDGAYTYAMGDPNAARTPSFQAVAYTNSDNDPATGTTLYGVDRNLGTLVRIASPNGGMVNTVGSLGLGMAPMVLGFDIVTMGTMNTAFLTTTADGNAGSNLYRVDLNTGATTLVGTVGGSAALSGLAVAVVPEPSTWALVGAGLLGVAGAVRRRTRVTA